MSYLFCGAEEDHVGRDALVGPDFDEIAHLDVARSHRLLPDVRQSHVPRVVHCSESGLVGMGEEPERGREWMVIMSQQPPVHSANSTPNELSHQASEERVLHAIKVQIGHEASKNACAQVRTTISIHMTRAPCRLIKPEIRTRIPLLYLKARDQDTYPLYLDASAGCHRAPPS